MTYERQTSAVPIYCASCGTEIQMPASFINAKSGQYHIYCTMPEEPHNYVPDRRVPKLYR